MSEPLAEKWGNRIRQNNYYLINKVQYYKMASCFSNEWNQVCRSYNFTIWLLKNSAKKPQTLSLYLITISRCMYDKKSSILLLLGIMIQPMCCLLLVGYYFKNQHYSDVNSYKIIKLSGYNDAFLLITTILQKWVFYSYGLDLCTTGDSMQKKSIF